MIFEAISGVRCAGLGQRTLDPLRTDLERMLVGSQPFVDVAIEPSCEPIISL